jgi:hypothetical protein
VAKIRTQLRDYVDPASRADPEKKALFGAASKVINLTVHIGVCLDPPSFIFSRGTYYSRFFKSLDRNRRPPAQRSLGQAKGRTSSSYRRANRSLCVFVISHG